MSNPPPFSRLVSSLPASVPFVPPEETERQKGRQIWLRLGANESTFGMSPKALEAMQQATAQSYLYGDATSYELRGELADFYGIERKNILIGSGIDELLGLTARVFLNPGDAVTTSLGGYPTFNYHVDGFGGILHTVPYQDFRNDLTGLAEKARETGSRILYLSNPDNPTGSFYPPEAIEKLRRSLSPDCLLLLDEAYVEFAGENAIWPIDPEDPQVIRTRTFSKAHGMAGARIGYILGNPKTLAAFDKIRNHFGVNRPAQAGALASLRDRTFLEAVVESVTEGKKEYARLAKETGFITLPSSTNFVTFDMGTAERARATMDDLWERGVFTRVPGTAPLNRLLRVSVGTPEERREFARVFREVVSSLPE
ncbi:aminotransferase class I/II-fold pyridoxal phosphate-dependent enzyme [Salinithrix halophila]|uniref:Aminotransferase class I/II-fold pyridoxal phosphate-dependent enzyme n=1 Tax=Salinithrix halophila TaxID=1485204 RepID=A0ABV8JDB3_9BACL